MTSHGSAKSEPYNKAMKSDVELGGSNDRCRFWHQPFQIRPSRRRYSTPLIADPLGVSALIDDMQSLLDPNFLQLTIPMLAAVVAWYANERRKRAWEEYERKEQNYIALLRASRGFYIDTQDTAKKAEFLDQVNLCWLYCPDGVNSQGICVPRHCQDGCERDTCRPRGGVR